MPIAFKQPNVLKQISYMNIGYANIEEEANNKFLCMVD
jgi:hypothetical protein